VSQKLSQATHFYVEPKNVDANLVAFTREESDHILKTFRLYIGDLIKATDGLGNLYDVKLSGYYNRVVSGDVIKISRLINELQVSITIAFGQPLQSKADQIIDHCTQLGANRFIPIVTKNSPLKLTDEKSGKRGDRWKKVAISSIKQSLRSVLPEIDSPMSVDELIRKFSEYELVLLGAFKGTRLEKSEAISNAKSVMLITGPEAGFGRIEEETLIRAGATPISLGERRLRAELAPIVMATLFLSHSGCDPHFG
jgi:16S rRNA (uracil1498-N3)-methyltransferase